MKVLESVRLVHVGVFHTLYTNIRYNTHHLQIQNQTYVYVLTGEHIPLLHGLWASDEQNRAV